MKRKEKKFVKKKYNFFVIAIVLFFCNCKKSNNYYQGIVVNENNQPLKNVVVITEITNEKTKTDSLGYFKISRNTDRLENLIFYKEGYKKDTIVTVFNQHGEVINYNFIENDTTIVKLATLKIQN